MGRVKNCLKNQSFQLLQRVRYYKELKRVTKRYIYFSLIGSESSCYGEEVYDIVVNTDHEKGTIQSYYDLKRIKSLFEDDFNKLVFLVKKTELPVLDEVNNISSRFYGLIDLGKIDKE